MALLIVIIGAGFGLLVLYLCALGADQGDPEYRRARRQIRRLRRGGAVSDKKSGFNLGNARHTVITILICVLVLRVVLWAILPMVPYLVIGAGLITIIGIALYRTNRF